jgi:ribonuclease HII
MWSAYLLESEAESLMQTQGMKTNTYVAGVDEVGIGPLAGPVVACAVILDPSQPIEGLGDSKGISEKRRQLLSDEIKERALSVSIGRASVEEIDALNVLQASHLAMRRAVEGLRPRPDHVLVDGNKVPDFGVSAEAIVQGDKTVPAISAASIVAKVDRDAELVALAERYPEYGFESHKGYPTAKHRRVLRTLGPCPEHRRSYAPVREALAQLSEGGSA